jgi:uncharacterized Zn finger protein
MYYESGGWRPYVPVHVRRAKALRAMQKRAKKGHVVSPVEVAGREIATTFWGRSWCRNLESYGDYANRLPRGRTYVRNGSVVHLEVGAGTVEAIVSGSELYTVKVSVAALKPPLWRSICKDCLGGIDSLVELLGGRFASGVMERVCRSGTGLFPAPREIRFECSCPDWASMCKHVASVLYGVGARLDRDPELLFRLRQVTASELVASAADRAPLAKKGPAKGRTLAPSEIPGVFGVEVLTSPPLPRSARARALPSAPPARKPVRKTRRPRRTQGPR